MYNGNSSSPSVERKYKIYGSLPRFLISANQIFVRIILDQSALRSDLLGNAWPDDHFVGFGGRAEKKKNRKLKGGQEKETHET